MKKFSFILGIAVVLVLALASLTFAAQAKVSDYYQPTKTFNADGITSYPNEIYLPNEASPASYRIHSNYSKNTDACASCHATHTAVGKSLLQWYSVYDTCMACHDGTVTTTYNVEEGYIGSSSNNRATYGGAFGVGNEDYLSNHNVSGALTASAAPGGSTVGVNVTVGHGTKNVWIAEFGCESCHTPHGQGGNARILNPDPNFVQTAAASATGYNTTAKDGSAYVVAAPATKAVASGYYYFINGYPYSISVYNLDDNAKLTATTQYTVDSSAGYTKISLIGLDPTAGIRVYGTPAMTVTMDIDNYLSSTESVKHLSGMNNFCGACHTDYNTQTAQTYTDGKFSGSGEKLTGTYSEAYRHQVGFSTGAAAGLVTEGGKMSCLTCHVAHGTSKDYWQRTLVDAAVKGPDGATWATGDLVEIAGSSALKRMPNMGTCEACHKKEIGNQGYAVNSGMTSSQTPATADGTMPNTYIYKAKQANYAASDLGWVGSDKCEPCHEDYVEGWQETGHKTSSHSGDCGYCHSPGNLIMNNGAELGNNFDITGGMDEGITCEACHGTGARHIKAPTSKNIFNPGAQSIERQAIECGKCHDMYNNTAADSFGNLGATSGTAAAPAGVYKTADLVNQANWTVAFRVYSDDPAKFTIASQRTATSSHYGGAWGYADSKHYLGGGTAANPSGIVSCNTCHNMHSDKHEGLLKLEYEQICAGCHDYGANFTQAVAMPMNAWNRHQIELRDFAHSFKFGPAANIAAMVVTPVNLEKAINGLTGISPNNTFYSVYDSAYGASGTYNLWRANTAGGGIGLKIQAYSDVAKTTPVYNNYAVEWELVSVPATLLVSDYIFESDVGAIEFTNPVPTSPGAANYTGATKTALDRFTGSYTIKYTNKANPSVTGTVTYTVKPRPID